MKQKILYIENEATIRAISFYKAALEASKLMGWEFHLAYHCLDYSEEGKRELENDLGLVFHQIDFERNPLHPGNTRAYHQLKNLLEERFDIIHCNTPIGGVLGRIVASEKGIRPVIYQAHGFHFYKGAPLKNWLLYYSVEKLLAKKTDAIITINQDDYQIAKKRLHPRSKVYYVPGVGIELGKWESSKNVRADCGLEDDDFVILAVGRLEKNKNCEMMIDAVRQIRDERVKLVFCGDGEDRQALQEKCQDLGNRVKFLGNRNDMPNIYHMADCFVLASFREGLSRSIMEAMACGLPCIVSNIRGNRDLVDPEGGFLFDPRNTGELTESVKALLRSDDLRAKMRIHNLEKIRQFGFDRVVKELTKVYEEQFGVKADREL